MGSLEFSKKMMQEALVAVSPGIGFGPMGEIDVITVCIRYTIDIHKAAEFERYPRDWSTSIPRCGGELLGYFLPTRIAGPTNIAYALINFADLNAYQAYRVA